jgi:hypothetical protein
MGGSRSRLALPMLAVAEPIMTSLLHVAPAAGAQQHRGTIDLQAYVQQVQSQQLPPPAHSSILISAPRLPINPITFAR